MSVLYALLGLLGGVLLTGVIASAFLFFSYVKQLRGSLDKLAGVLNSLSGDNTLAESLTAFRELVNTGKSMMVKLDALNTSVQMFYRIAVRSDLAAAAPPSTGTEESQIYGYNEEAAAARETQSRLRREGVDIRPEEPFPANKAVGAQV